MDLRILSVLLIACLVANAETACDGDEDAQYEKLLGMVTDLESTLLQMKQCKQTTNFQQAQHRMYSSKTKNSECNQQKEETRKILSGEQLCPKHCLLQYTECCRGHPNPYRHDGSTLFKKTKETQEIPLSRLGCSSVYCYMQLKECCAAPPPTDQHDCSALFEMGYTDNGVYTITPGDTPIKVYCDMINEGWTVIQKRTDGSLDYNRAFVEYENGFGVASGEYWLGLKAMHDLTSSGDWYLYFELEDFSGGSMWMKYRGFHVGAATDYTLKFDRDNHTGDQGDSLVLHYDMKFTTRDRDQDTAESYNCATQFCGGGGWWFFDCADVLTTGHDYGKDWSIKWDDWHGSTGLKSAVLLIKPY